MSHAKAFVEAHGARSTSDDAYEMFLDSILPEGTKVEDNMEADRGSHFNFPDGTEAKTQPSEDDVNQLIALICGSEANGEGEGDDADEDSEDDESEDEDVSEDESEDA